MNKLLLFLLLLPLGAAAQPALKASRQAQMTYSKYDAAFFVLDDSTKYYTYRPKEGKWVKHNLHLVLSDGYIFNEFKQRFYPLAIGKGHYLFVQDGCGMVYELKKDTLRRIDQSYDQKHQFGAAMYAYKGVPYLFGGYGLFRTNNLHTYFDSQAKEWFETEDHGTDIPSERDGPFLIQHPHTIYIMGGFSHMRNKFKVLNDIWAYSHRTKKWKLLGELNPRFTSRTRMRGFQQNKDYSLFTMENKLTVVDVKNKKYYSYVSNRYYNFHRIVTDRKNSFVMVGTHNSANVGAAHLKVLPVKKILYGNPTEYYLYKPISYFKLVPLADYLCISVLINVLLFFVIFYLRRLTKMSWYKPKNPVLEPADFTELEWTVLNLIRQNNELELSALNKYFDEEGLSFETLKKRRESFIKALRVRLALITRREVDSLLIEIKHPLDKRMKVICWDKDLSMSGEKKDDQ